MNLFNRPVGELATKSELSRMVLEKNNIDYCCNGKKSISEICSQRVIDTDALMNELESAIYSSQSHHAHYELWSIPFLVSYIVENHHNYLKEKLPLILQMLEHVVEHHGTNFPEIIQVKNLFVTFSEELYIHIFREEEELFSYIKRLAKLKEEGKHTTPPYFGSITALENQFASEHNATGNELALLRELTNNFNPPTNSCKTQKKIYELLRDVYYDTKLHIHLENNILFPKALDLEKKVVISQKVTH